jgi:hypothetical protein
MRVVHVRVNQADFGKRFEAMREWLDLIERFETKGGVGGQVIVKAQFADDDLAELFRREFQGNYGD